MSGLEFVISSNAPQIADALAKVPELTLQNLDGALARGAIEVADEARRRAPKYRSELTNSIIPERKALVEHIVRANAGYARYVEEGTGKGGWAPRGEMLAWVKAKGIQPHDPRMSLETLASLIRMRIAQHGIKKNPFFFASLEAKRPRLDELVHDAAQDALDHAGGHS